MALPSRPGRVRRPILLRLAVIGLLIVGGLVWIAWLWGSGRAERQRYAQFLSGQTAEVTTGADLEFRVKAFCGDCHAVPRPESFHRDAWHEEVQRGYEFYAQSGRTDLAPPPIVQTVAYFRSRAPKQLVYQAPKEGGEKYRVSFKAERLDLDKSTKSPPAIAGLRWVRLRADAPPVVVASDMMSGEVTSLDPRGPRRTVRRLAQLNNPCRVEPCDLDGDGSLDLLVADLGSYAAVDHDRGRVVWLRQDKRTGRFDEVVLASGLGRVADVRPIEADARGTADLVVAEFGRYRTGKIVLLRNVAGPGRQPRFEPEELDPRTGTIHVPVVDLDGDGRQDFVALVSNESECVEAFLNQGGGKFRRETLWQAPDLAFASSGIWLVDLDGDGDMDILYANGDAFDNRYVSPWHGVQWPENLGNVQFRYHRLTDMPGATVALPGDFDGDGRLDILVVALLPRGMRPDTLAVQPLPSVVLLEQTSPGHFVRHTLETGFPCHGAAVIGDFDDDGRLDFAVANHMAGHHADALGQSWLTIWWNQGRRAHH